MVKTGAEHIDGALGPRDAELGCEETGHDSDSDHRPIASIVNQS